MWRPASITCRQSIEGRSLLQLTASKVCLSIRNTNDGNIESRYGKSKSGWFTRKGTKAGYPPSWPHQSRVVGIDLNLQERFDEMYKDRRKAEKIRKDVGKLVVQKGMFLYRKLSECKWSREFFRQAETKGNEVCVL